MDKLVWRTRAQIVAWIDIVFSFLGMLVFAVIVIFAVAIITGPLVIGNDSKPVEEFSRQGLTGKLNSAPRILWLVVAFSAFWIGLQMWAAMQLLESSKLGLHSGEALIKARSWRNVSFTFLVVSIIGGVVTWYWVFILITLWYITALFVVYKFMKELESTKDGHVISFSGGVIISKK